jgi:hypothetical protein
MRLFRHYKPSRYTTNKDYIGQSYSKRCKELCKTCGYPWGAHFGDNCPESTDSHIRMKPEFYRVLSNKIKTI